MKRLLVRSPIWHAMAWIVGYVVLVNVGDVLSEANGVPNGATAALLMVMSVVAVAYLRSNGWLRHFGLRWMRAADFSSTLYYLPLLAIGLLQFAKGPREGLDLQSVLIVVVLMLGVGFVEELVFRGFLYRALRTRHGVVASVLISGVSFGVGHVVNLARGYTGSEQLLQILVAAVVGVVLALLFAITGTIVPGIVFHVLFNISGNVTAQDPRLEAIVVVATVVIGLLYAPVLFRRLARQTAHDGVSAGPVAAKPAESSLGTTP